MSNEENLEQEDLGDSLLKSLPGSTAALAELRGQRDEGHRRLKRD